MITQFREGRLTGDVFGRPGIMPAVSELFARDLSMKNSSGNAETGFAAR